MVNKESTFTNRSKTEESIEKNFSGTDDLGSATSVSLDSHSGSDGHVTQEYLDDRKEADDFTNRGAPWSVEPSLEARCEEIGINFDDFITGLKNNYSDSELSNKLNVSEETITNLREYFEKKGLDSVMGQD